ncbi:hypothetical protein [Rhizobium sp. 1399]|uniref:hypothetical protein n=1 Tax=Rhizobium sp. 1399 TaxID=2817758 RepID=UPI002866BD94|nr:hypothetical protein [Rhizobium sp. 1399]MDR6667094.1 serine/threonine protein phosphatase 1 [Rhizobium sp. 1399]
MAENLVFHFEITMRKDSIFTYVVGFVLGRADLLRELLFAIDRNAKKRKLTYRIFFLGNLIDFSPDSKGAVELALHAVSRNPGSGLLLGRFEDALLQMIDETDRSVRQRMLSKWVGDPRSLQEIHVRIGKPEVSTDLLTDAIDQRHLSFIRKARRFIELDDHVLVHAGLEPGVHLLEQDPASFLKAPGGFENYRGSFGKIVVHGTSNPVDPVESYPNRIAINSTTQRNGRLPAICIDPDGAVHWLSAQRSGSRGVEIFSGQPSIVE